MLILLKNQFLSALYALNPLYQRTIICILISYKKSVLSALYAVNPLHPRPKKPKKTLRKLNAFFKYKYINYFLINPKSTNLSYKNSPAEISSYFLGLFSSIQFSKTSSRMSLTGCIKNGIE